MALKSVVSAGEFKVEVRELTVGEVRDWLKLAAINPDRDPISVVLFEECTLSDLMYMTDLNESTIEAMSQSEVRKVLEECKKLNPDFFAFRLRVVELSKAEPEPQPKP